MNTFNHLYNNIFLNNSLCNYTNDNYGNKFKQLSQLLSNENKKHNLTAIKKEELIIPLHFADSLLGAEYIPENSTVLDVGSGAGFPTLPLAIARPDIKITALDSTAKKMDFVRKTALKLELENVSTTAKRAEEAAHEPKMRETFDLVCARAVSRLNILAELCLPFVKKDGYFLAMKGALGKEEYEEARKGIELLGGAAEKIEEKDLYISDEESQKRTFILIKKVQKTPIEYPRIYSKILKKPL